MKYQVQIKYTNPSHEHVSLRRRVESVTRLVEAANEQEAINRAASQQRALGFMIKEAKILSKPFSPSPQVIAEAKKEDSKDKTEMMDDEKENDDEEEEDDEEDDETEVEDVKEAKDVTKDLRVSLKAMDLRHGVDSDKRDAGYKMSPTVRAAQAKSDVLSKVVKRPQAGTLAAAKMKEEVEYIEEKLTAADPASKWISDFVASENPKFAGKTKKERINMALGAYYAAKRGTNEEVEQIDELKKSTLASYVNKAANQVRAKSGIAASFETQGTRKRNPENKSAYMDVAKDFRQGAKKRLTGIEKATAKLAKEEVEQVEEGFDTDPKDIAAYLVDRHGKGKVTMDHIEAYERGRDSHRPIEKHEVMKYVKKMSEDVEQVEEADTKVVNKEVKADKTAKATETMINLAKSKKNKVDAKPTLDLTNTDKKYVTKV